MPLKRLRSACVRRLPPEAGRTGARFELATLSDKSALHFASDLFNFVSFASARRCTSIPRTRKNTSRSQLLSRGDHESSGSVTGRQQPGTFLALYLAEPVNRQPILMIRAATHNFARPQPQIDPMPKVLAEFSTEPATGEPMQGRWTRVRITLIAPDQYLCEKARGPTPLECRTATVSNLESAKAFFGGGWVVKELFAALDPVRFPRWP